MHGDSGFEPGFPAVGHAILRTVRDGHFWFDHRKACILDALRERVGDGRRARVLEFGCGDGDVLAALAREHRAFGLERRLEDLIAARSAEPLAVVAGEGGAPPFSRSFDVVGLFDVVEHVADDAGLLRIAASLARPGGWVFLTVPADPALWTTLDEYAGHRRRYTRRMLEDLCQRASLELVSTRPLFRSLWPLARLRALLRRNGPIENPEDEYRVAPIWNRTLAAILRIEHAVFTDSQLGRGTSWIAVARIGS